MNTEELIKSVERWNIVKCTVEGDNVHVTCHDGQEFSLWEYRRVRNEELS